MTDGELLADLWQAFRDGARLPEGLQLYCEGVTTMRRTALAATSADATAASVAPEIGYLPIGRAATQLGVTEATVRRWIRDGTLPGYYIGRRLYVKPDEVAKLARPVTPGEFGKAVTG